MAKLKLVPDLQVVINLGLTEKEAAALKFLSEFDTKDILNKLTGQYSRQYDSTSRSAEHAEGMKTFLESMKTMGSQLSRIERARKILEGKKDSDVE